MSFNVYTFDDYKLIFNQWVENKPKSGRGAYRKLAIHLGVSSTMVSQVFKGDKHLNAELGLEVCEFIGLGGKESKYFLLLIDYARAGSFKLKQIYQDEIKELQQQAKKLSNHMKKDKDLAEKTMAQYYSDWLYTGVRNLSALKNVNSVDEISNYLNVPSTHVQKIVDFLLEHQLCVLDKDKNLSAGPQNTHLSSDSNMINFHHHNWRMKSMEKMKLRKSDDLFYSCPMSLSKKTAENIRVELPVFLKKINNWVGPSKSDVVRCLNIDWFRY